MSRFGLGRNHVCGERDDRPVHRLSAEKDDGLVADAGVSLRLRATGLVEPLASLGEEGECVTVPTLFRGGLGGANDLLALPEARAELVEAEPDRPFNAAHAALPPSDSQ